MTSDAQPAVHLAVQQLEKRFGPVQALRGVSLSIAPGEKVLLTGPNGSGKSTLLRIVAGLVRPSRGVLSFLGRRVPALPAGSAGYLGHGLQLFGTLTVRENLELFAALRGITSGCDDLITRWNLRDFHDRRVKTLSRGLQARVGLARACVGSPQVLLLDEPSANLDVGSVETLRAFLDEPTADGRRRTVVLASHDVDRFEPWADRIIVLDRGRVSMESSGKREAGR